MLLDKNIKKELICLKDQKIKNYMNMLKTAKLNASDY